MLISHRSRLGDLSLGESLGIALFPPSTASPFSQWCWLFTTRQHHGLPAVFRDRLLGRLTARVGDLGSRESHEAVGLRGSLVPTLCACRLCCGVPGYSCGRTADVASRSSHGGCGDSTKEWTAAAGGRDAALLVGSPLPSTGHSCHLLLSASGSAGGTSGCQCKRALPSPKVLQGIPVWARLGHATQGPPFEGLLQDSRLAQWAPTLDHMMPAGFGRSQPVAMTLVGVRM